MLRQQGEPVWTVVPTEFLRWWERLRERVGRGAYLWGMTPNETDVLTVRRTYDPDIHRGAQ